MEVRSGDSAELDVVVDVDDTAAALGSGSLRVLGTPRLLAWCEQATCRVLDGRLPEGSTSVGTTVRLDHLAPSDVGERLVVRAEVIAVDGRRVAFTVAATDAVGRVVGRGTVERVVVEADRFLARLRGQVHP
ncbi:MAG TPA: hotdog domain-containing protein [Ornithinibacter sp.]|nr:hotdog domain-containing protein [Ornithinibacter sp.]